MIKKRTSKMPARKKPTGIHLNKDQRLMIIEALSDNNTEEAAMIKRKLMK